RVFCAAHWLYLAPPVRGRGLARALVARGRGALEGPRVTHLRLAGGAGRTQWAARGCIPYLVHHALPLAAVRAGVAERPTANRPPAAAPTAPAPPPDAAPPKKRRHRRTRPRPQLVAGGRA